MERGAGWEAWQPPAAGVTEPEATDTTLALPDDLDPGRYLLAINVHEEELGNSATYGAIVRIR